MAKSEIRSVTQILVLTLLFIVFIVLIPDLVASSVVILVSGTDTKLFRGKEASCPQLTLKWFKQKNNMYMHMYICTMYRKKERGEQKRERRGNRIKQLLTFGEGG